MAHPSHPVNPPTSRVREPRQDRARESKRRILDAAEDVLARMGTEGFTTRAVAAAAGVNVGTLYAYFPDRMALMRDVIARYETERSTAAIQGEAALATPDWREALAAVLLELARARTRRPAGLALRRTVVGSPELRDLDEKSTQRVARRLAGVLRRSDPDLPAARASRIARLTLVVLTEGLDDACRHGRVDTAAVRELTAMVAGYLAPHLDAPWRSALMNDTPGRT